MKHSTKPIYGFIGTGNMAKAGIIQLLHLGIPETQIRVTSPSIANQSHFQIHTQNKIYNIKTTSNNNNLINTSDYIILGFKPQQLSNALSHLVTPSEKKWFISIIAGLPIEVIAHYLKSKNITRLMPNTPSSIGKGIGANYTNPSLKTSDAQKLNIHKIIKAFGCPVKLENEDKMDIVTAISGSGVAYVYLLIEYLLEFQLAQLAQTIESVRLSKQIDKTINAFKAHMKTWSKNHNLSHEDSKLLVDKTFEGANALIEQTFNSASPATVQKVVELQRLRENVTSKNGTTYAALQAFSKNNHLQKKLFEMLQSRKDSFGLLNKHLKIIIFEAMDAAYHRAIELKNTEKNLLTGE